MSNPSSSVSSSVSTDTIKAFQTPSKALYRPSSNPILITPSLTTTLTHTPRTETPTQIPLTTPIALQTQRSLIIPLSDTEVPLDPFEITPTHSPPPCFSHIPDPSDIAPKLLRNINKPHIPENLPFLPPSKAAVVTLSLIILSLFLKHAPTLNLDLFFPLLNL